jgi:hypothetical protein
MIRSLAVFFAGTACLLASSTASWEMSTFTDFSKGRFTGLALSRDGRITLSPRLNTVLASDQPAIWAVAQAPDGSLYVGTGHRGRIYRVQPSGKSDVVWTSPQPEIFALAVGPDGALYAGTSPDGRVYRIHKGKATEYFNPQSKYIWALAFGKDNALYVGTGDQGKIFRVTRAGAGEVWYETGQSHVTAFAFDNDSRLLAGSEPNGLLYRISGKDKAFVLYDANLPEIRSITVAPDGAVYAAALGGGLEQRTQAAATAAQTAGQPGGTPTTTTTITVTDETQAGPELEPKPAEAPKTAAPPATIAPGTVVYTAPQAAVTGVEKSAVYRINPDDTVETMWTSKEENAYDVLLRGNELILSTDAEGRVYRVAPDRRVTLMVQTNEGETTRLVSSGDSILAATGTTGKLVRLGPEPSARGVYESPVHDAGSVARWGQMSWRGERLGNAQLVFRTRVGNSARPDRTWTEWSEPLSDPARASVTSPNARFIQWRAEFASNGVASPSLTGVTVSYLPQNNPPAVRSINVTTQIAPDGAAKSAVPAQNTMATYSVTVTDTGEAGASTLSGTPTQTVSRGLSQQIQLSWHADDPDGDRLTYGVYFRGEDESQWKMLRTNFAESMLTLEGDVLADGKYLFRIVASDKQSNAGSTAREAELVSAPILFDNTPPTVTATVKRTGMAVEVTVEARDVTSSLRRAEYSLDAAAWVPVEPVDGVIDGETERFVLRLDNVQPGEHIVVFRAFDSSNNAGLAKVVVQ